MQDRKNTEQGTMQDKPSQEGYRSILDWTGGMHWWDAGKCRGRTGGMRNRRDAGQEEYRKGGMQDRWDAGLEVCMNGGMQERRDAGTEGYRKGGLYR